MQELISHGHSVVGLARSEEAEQKLIDAGADVVRGELEDLEVLKIASLSAEGTIHLGFSSYDNYEKSLQIDRDLITTICDAYIGTYKLFINTSGTLTLAGDGSITAKLDEDQDPSPEGMFSGRGFSELLARSYIAKGVTTLTIRLSEVHGKGDRSYIPTLMDIARKSGYSGYPVGSNVWPAVHRLDVATLYRLAAESPSTGLILHAVAEESVLMKDIAEAIATNLNVPTRPILVDDLASEIDPFYGPSIALNNCVSADKTKRITGWKPSHVGLWEDIINNY